MNPSWGWAAGGVISTTNDLARYAKALGGGGLLSRQMQAQRLASPEPIDPSKPDGTAYGFGIIKYGEMYGHTGELPGYDSYMGYDPKTRHPPRLPSPFVDCTRTGRSQPRTSFRQAHVAVSLMPATPARSRSSAARYGAPAYRSSRRPARPAEACRRRWPASRGAGGTRRPGQTPVDATVGVGEARIAGHRARTRRRQPEEQVVRAVVTARQRVGLRLRRDDDVVREARSRRARTAS